MAADEKEVERNFTKALWLADQEEKFADKDARQAAFKEARVEYSKKARKLLRVMGSRGVGITAVEQVVRKKK